MMNEFNKQCEDTYEGAYTASQVELNNQLYAECSKPVLDCRAIEDLLRRGADPLGATSVSGYGLFEHIYSMLICDSLDSQSVHLPQITELFLKYGMDVAKPKVPYDGEDSLHPLWCFEGIPNANGIAALKMLLDAGLDVDSAAEFWTHVVDDQINCHREDPNDPEYADWFSWAFKMIMLIASYDHILDHDEDLREFIGYEHNHYDTHKFRNWDYFRYEFDTSRCGRHGELYKAVVNIYEIESNKKIWRIGVCLKNEEF